MRTAKRTQAGIDAAATAELVGERPGVSLKPRDAPLPKPYLYLLFDARWRVVCGGVWDALSLPAAVYLIRAGDEEIERAAFLFVSSGAKVWTGYAVLPLNCGGVTLLDDERHMTTEQLMDVEKHHRNEVDDQDAA